MCLNVRTFKALAIGGWVRTENDLGVDPAVKILGITFSSTIERSLN